MYRKIETRDLKTFCESCAMVGEQAAQAQVLTQKPACAIRMAGTLRGSNDCFKKDELATKINSKTV